jgi:hypothetical protein
MFSMISRNAISRTAILPLAVIVGVASVISFAARNRLTTGPVVAAHDDGLADVVETIDQHLEAHWTADELTPAKSVGDLHILRRLSLALHGTIPSLEEIRRFEADTAPHRMQRWTTEMLADTRFADYFAERLARGFVGVEGGQFVVYRRGHFVNWLAGELAENKPYDEIVRTIIASKGRWTDTPATNFVTAAIASGDIDENKLAGRTVRAFLGQRIDCAQCHDHPFVDAWKQSHFEGLAAQFGQAELTAFGVEDRSHRKYEIEDGEPPEKRTVKPGVPFHPEWLPKKGTRRERLAGWVTHPQNRRFERAIANRVWGLMFGRPFNAPVDDLPDPGDPTKPDVLDLLGADFRAHGCDLRRLIRVIAATRAFRLDSVHSAADDATWEQLEKTWAVFPMTRLRPEQVIGSMLQAASLRTIDRNSHLIVRLIRLLRENQFVKEYGDLGESELDEQAGTIPQALLRMNGKLSRDTTAVNILNASGRISAFAQSDEQTLETIFLVCLTTRPSATLRSHFLRELKKVQGEPHRRVIEDVFWDLFNSEGFSWNH